MSDERLKKVGPCPKCGRPHRAHYCECGHSPFGIPSMIETETAAATNAKEPVEVVGLDAWIPNKDIA